jgi:hypothetical protein
MSAVPDARVRAIRSDGPVTGPPVVVVLNWNNAADTLDCLVSLRTSTIPLTVIAVDNGSTDGSAEEIEESGLADQP